VSSGQVNGVSSSKTMEQSGLGNGAATRAFRRSIFAVSGSYRQWTDFRLTITGIVVLIIVALTLPLIAVMLLALHSVSEANQSAQRNNLTYIARTIAVGVDAEIDTYRALASALAVSDALLSDDLTKFDTLARRATANYPTAWVVVTDLDGQQLVNTSVAPGVPLGRRSVGGLAAQARAIATGQLEVSDLTFGAARQLWTVTVELLVSTNGAPHRVLTIATTLDGFNALLARQTLPPGWLVAIIDRQGNFVARVPRGSDIVGKPAGAGFRSKTGQEGLWEWPSLEGDLIVQANAVSQITGWTVGVAISKDTLAAISRRTLSWAGPLALVIAAMGIVVALFLTRRIASSLADFRNRTVALVQNGHVEFKSDLPEISETWNALATAVKSRLDAENELRRSEEKLQMALDAAAMGLWEYNIPDGTISWDARFKAIFDVGEDAAHLDTITQHVLPDDIPVVRSALEAAFAPVNAKPYFVRYRIRRSDGAVRWVEAYGATEFAGMGEHRRAVRLVGTVADITEDKSIEEQTQLLMHEVAHRSKNVLSLVQSIARLTAKSANGDFATNFIERIQALAASQDVIVNGNWHAVSLHDLVRSQLLHFKDLIGSRIVLEGDAITISPLAAQTIGMALHELATNASKYGALSDGNGRIVIVWQLTQTETGEQFEINWIERGGPLVVAPQRRGFGSTVIETMTKGGLAANVRLDYPPAGLEWHLSCPAAVVKNSA
jgi:PAS domain S-box-containing protein